MFNADLNPPSYIVYRAVTEWCVARQDSLESPFTKIGRVKTRNEAVKIARLLAGRSGRWAVTTDVTTYPW